MHNKKTIVFNLTLLVVGVILYFILGLFTFGAVSIIAAVLALIVNLIMSAVVSVIFSLFTKEKEKMLSYTFIIFTAVLWVAVLQMTLALVLGTALTQFLPEGTLMFS